MTIPAHQGFQRKKSPDKASTAQCTASPRHVSHSNRCRCSSDGAVHLEFLRRLRAD
jgi:hypothetical protein